MNVRVFGENSYPPYYVDKKISDTSGDRIESICICKICRASTVPLHPTIYQFTERFKP